MNNRSGYSQNSRGWNPLSLLGDLRITWRLLRHPRVPAFLKLVVPLVGIAYMVSPLDLVPLNPVDDIGVLLVLARFFVSMAPTDVVNEIRYGNPHGAQDVRNDWDEDAVQTTWSVVDDE